jgi:hypothetical protein
VTFSADLVTSYSDLPHLRQLCEVCEGTVTNMVRSVKAVGYDPDQREDLFTAPVCNPCGKHLNTNERLRPQRSWWLLPLYWLASL